MERRRLKNKNGTGFGKRHYSKYSSHYTSVATLSPKESAYLKLPAKRKQGNLSPLTPPFGSTFDFKDFYYSVGPTFPHAQVQDEKT